MGVIDDLWDQGLGHLKDNASPWDWSSAQWTGFVATGFMYQGLLGAYGAFKALFPLPPGETQPVDVNHQAATWKRPG